MSEQEERLALIAIAKNLLAIQKTLDAILKQIAKIAENTKPREYKYK